MNGRDIRATRLSALPCARGALALSLDDWMVARGADDELSAEVAQEQWQTAAAALQAGRDVVLDWGFDSRQERDEIRARAAAIQRLVAQLAEPPEGAFLIQAGQPAIVDPAAQ